MTRTLAILVGGGPAPGLNGVINAVTLAATARGWRVLGIPRGFSLLMKGDVSEVRELTPERVAGIEQRGGSILFTSRANPKKDPAAMRLVCASLKKLGVTDLVTLGGDDTASSAAAVAEACGDGMRVAHVPKTIDNDLPLPGNAPTFGFETARDLGASLVANLVEDAQTTGRWYLVTAMGRTAGHLAMGVGLAGGAHLTVIPEEFGSERISLRTLTDLVAAAVAKRAADGHDNGVVVLAEGILDRMDPAEMTALQNVERDEHGHPRLSEISLGKVLKDTLKPTYPKTTFVAKELGYELRCAPPTGFDKAYTRTLGTGAVTCLADGSCPTSCLVSLQEGRIVPLSLVDLRDPATGKVRVRLVDAKGDTWRAAKAVQARLSQADLHGERLDGLAKAIGMAPTDLRARFTPLVDAGHGL